MPAAVPDLAQVRLDNALRLFEEFVRSTARHADAAALRGLERRFAEQVDIQPSYWSQLKSRSRQIGERLARQFETRCNKPFGWMDQRHDLPAAASAPAALPPAPPPVGRDDSLPADDDERFIIGLVLTYYRRHPQRARTRLLDLLGEVLTPGADPTAAASATATAVRPAAAAEPAPAPRLAPGVIRPPRPAPAPAPAVDDPHALWLQSQSGVAPLKPKK